jgi:curli biogenesis system outer membrane secretion channel CsgG
MKRFTLLLFSLVFTLPLVAQMKKSLAIDTVTLSPSVLAGAESESTEKLCLQRFQEQLDTSLLNALSATNKYTIVDRSEKLSALIKEINLSESGLVGSKNQSLGQMIGADYLLIPTITSFSLSDSAAVINGINYSRLVCSVSLQTRIVDVETGQIHSTNDIHVSQNTLTDNRFQSAETNHRFDSILPTLVSNATKQCAQQLTTNIYPPRVIYVDDNIVTINRGKDTFNVGDMLTIMAPGRKITDPDTGETYEIPGRICGIGRVIYVDGNVAQVEMEKGASVKIGARAIK